jgi:hypothetical protein
MSSIVLASWIQGSLASAAEPTKYTLEDLRALGESQSWGELIEHVEDVRPSERKKEWKDLLDRAAIGQIDSLREQKRAQEAHATAEQLMTRFGILKQSKPFMKKRGEAGLEVFAECMSNAYGGAQCIEQLEAFVGVDNKDAELAFQAGKLVVERGRMYPPASPFFARAFEDKSVRSSGCKDPSVQAAVLRSFGQPAHYDTAKAADKVAFDHCFEALQKGIWESFYGSWGYEAVNICSGFMRKKVKLSAFQSAFCQDQQAKK